MKNLKINGFRGINNVDAAERVQSLPSKDQPLIELVEATNVDIDDSGRLSRRAGQELKIAGAAHSLWSNGEVCLFMQGGLLHWMNAAYGSAAISSGWSGDAMSYVDVNGVVYMTDNFGAAALDGGGMRSWGIPIGDADVAASATSGNMEAGIYLFVMTLLREDGFESGAGLAKRIDLTDGQGIAFSWSVPSDPSIMRANLYVTQPNGETLFLAATVNIEAGSYTYTGGQRSLPLNTQWLDAPPSGSALAAYRGRIYIAKDDVVFATAPVGYEYCDRRDYRAFDGSEVRVLAPVESGLFVGTASKVYFLRGASFADQELVTKMDCGAIRGSVVIADGDVATGRAELSGIKVALFATTEGIVMGLPDGSLQNMTQDRYDMIEATSAAAILRKGQATQYLLATKSPQ